MQDAEGKGYGAASPFGEILPAAQQQQEVGAPREEAITIHSPSQRRRPMLRYLLRFATGQNAARA